MWTDVGSIYSMQPCEIIRFNPLPTLECILIASCANMQKGGCVNSSNFLFVTESDVGTEHDQIGLCRAHILYSRISRKLSSEKKKQKNFHKFHGLREFLHETFWHATPTYMVYIRYGSVEQ